MSRSRPTTARAGARWALGSALALLAVACTFAAPPFANLTGTWQSDPNPSGRGWVLALTARGDSLTGYGFRLGLEGHVADTVAVAGRAQGASVWIRLAPAHGDTASFDGRIVSSTHLGGTLAESGARSGTLSLHRE